MKKLLALLGLALGLALAQPAFAGGWSIQQEAENSRWLDDQGNRMPLGDTSGIPFVFSSLATNLTVYAVSPKTGYVVKAYYVTGSPAAGSTNAVNLVDFWLESVSEGRFTRITAMQFRIMGNTDAAKSDVVWAATPVYGGTGTKYPDSARVYAGQVIAVHTGGGGTGASPVTITVVVE